MVKRFTLQDAIDASLDYSGKTSIPSYMKWSGNKNHPEYLRGYRTALRNAGRNRGGRQKNRYPGKEEEKNQTERETNSHNWLVKTNQCTCARASINIILY